MKDNCFEWEVAQYCDVRRPQGPDREVFIIYTPLREVLLRAAPCGFPNLAQLREVRLWLQSRFRIMRPELQAKHKDPMELASEACDRARLMLTHLLDLNPPRQALRTVSCKIYLN